MRDLEYVSYRPKRQLSKSLVEVIRPLSTRLINPNFHIPYVAISVLSIRILM